MGLQLVEIPSYMGRDNESTDQDGAACWASTGSMLACAPSGTWIFTLIYIALPLFSTSDSLSVY